MTRPILKGEWGGDWEFISSKPSNQTYTKKCNIFTVRSVRTGYVTRMLDSSFIND